MSFDPIDLRGRRLRAFTVSELHIGELGLPDPADPFTFCMAAGRYFKPPADMRVAASWSDPKNRAVVALCEHPWFEPYDPTDRAEPLELFVDKSNLGRLAPPLVSAPAPLAPPRVLPPPDAVERAIEAALDGAGVGPWLTLPEGVAVAPRAPIDLLLWCPRCLTLHVDAPEPATGWTNPPHRSHKCHNCGTVWRPADVPTNGVAAIRTRGEADTFPPPPLTPRPESE